MVVTISYPQAYPTKKAYSLSNQENIDKEIQKEERIVEASKKDLSQFEFLYNKYFDKIFQYIYNRIGDEAETSDLVSKVFVNAMNAINKYECRGLPFGAWLFRIATNELNKHYRTAKNRVICIDEYKLNELWVCENAEESKDKIKVIQKLIAELSDEEILIIQMKFFESYNFKEIAEITNKKESAVKMKMYRALNKLKLKYEKNR